MPNKWSKVIKEPSASQAIEPWDMVDLEAERLAGEKEPPHDCSLLQQEAFEAGVQVGIQQGRDEAKGPAEAEMKRAMDLVSQVEQLRLDAARQAESDIGELAMAVARKVIHREAAVDPDIVVTQVHQSITCMEEKGLIWVRVNPKEVDHLQNFHSSFTGADGKHVSLRIEGDENVSPGGCVVESSQYFIDATLEKQLEEIWLELMMSHARAEPPPAP